MHQLYSIFHLNLAYSSIEEEQRSDVIRCCYWPLLKLARDYNLPFGIEATGYTLESISQIDPDWIAELRQLVKEGSCEFIGSGYAQIIGPLVPAEVNAANLRLGHQVYEQMLGFRPDIALVNEQAYSAGLVRHYIEAGYRAIVMEWDNPARFHPEWDAEWRYLPQIACGQHGEGIPIIWNKAIAFQKFQRYAHGEMEIAEYLEYLCRHLSDKSRAFSLYCNDAEIFDFRPGRYHTEASLHEDGEWNRIDRFFEALLSDSRFHFISPIQALDLMELPEAGNKLHLESSEQPIPVKKQGKYNITRWAVTGRDDLSINTTCWRIFESLKTNPVSNDDDWLELCYLWSSDFRTHITEKRWKAYKERLKKFEKKIRGQILSKDDSVVINYNQEIPAGVDLSRNGRILTIVTKNVKILFNCCRGLAIDKLWFNKISDQWICGTLYHGYFDDIQWGADYYTGHLVFEAPGLPKVTDLNPINPLIWYDSNNNCVSISGTVRSPLGDIHKQIDICLNDSKINILYQLDWKKSPVGALRLGNVTLNPDAFVSSSLFFRSSNGGISPEIFYINGRPIDHARSVSFLVSAEGGFGTTDGKIDLGDSQNTLRIVPDKEKSALIGMVQFHKVAPSYFYRLILSASEVDETSRERDNLSEPLIFSYSIEA